MNGAQTFLFAGALLLGSVSDAGICIQPREETTHACRGQSDAGIGRSVIEVDGVAIRADGLTAREHDVVHISDALVGGFGTEDPFVSAFEADLGLVDVKEREAEAIDASRGGNPHTVVDHQPAFGRFDGRRA